MLRLEEELIIKTEEAIKSDMLDTTNDLCISCQYYRNAVETWKLIKNSEKNSYKQFASNGAGMTSYGFYKANDGQIYIIEAFMNDITSVYLASTNINFLKRAIKDEEKNRSELLES